MKRIAHLWISWADRYGQPPKTPEQLARDKQRVKEILERAGYGHLFSEERGLVIDVEVGSKEFGILIEELQKDPHLIPPGGLDIRQFYTRLELESAQLLIWGPTNQAIEDDYYSLYFKEGQEKGIKPYTRDCERCGAPLEQVRDLWVPTAKMGKRDLALTYSWEVVLSTRLAGLLQESGLTGFTLRPVWDYRRPYQGEPRLFQLVVTNVLPPMASPPTEFEQVKHCGVCGTTTRYLKHIHFWGKIQYYEDTDVHYPKGVLEKVKDFNIAVERFGELRGAHKMVVITQRVYRWLREQKVKNWAAVPVYLVD